MDSFVSPLPSSRAGEISWMRTSLRIQRSNDSWGCSVSVRELAPAHKTNRRAVAMSAFRSKDGIMHRFLQNSNPSATPGVDQSKYCINRVQCTPLNRQCCTDLAVYIYIFLGGMALVGLISLLVYCYHQRRLQRYVEHDNLNNNMQRHSLVDR